MREKSTLDGTPVKYEGLLTTLPHTLPSTRYFLSAVEKVRDFRPELWISNTLIPPPAYDISCQTRVVAAGAPAASMGNLSASAPSTTSESLWSPQQPGDPAANLHTLETHASASLSRISGKRATMSEAILSSTSSREPFDRVMAMVASSSVALPGPRKPRKEGNLDLRSGKFENGQLCCPFRSHALDARGYHFPRHARAPRRSHRHRDSRDHHHAALAGRARPAARPKGRAPPFDATRHRRLGLLRVSPLRARPDGPRAARRIRAGDRGGRARAVRHRRRSSHPPRRRLRPERLPRLLRRRRGGNAAPLVSPFGERPELEPRGRLRARRIARRGPHGSSHADTHAVTDPIADPRPEHPRRVRRPGSQVQGLRQRQAG